MAKVDGDKLKARYEKARAEYQEHQKRERQKRRKLKAKQDTERKLGVVVEVMPEGAPVPTVAGPTLAVRLGLDIQVKAMER